MSDQNQSDIYYANAIDCVRMAVSSTDESRKLALLKMSQAWLDLAHLAEKKRTVVRVEKTSSSASRSPER